ncbi:MAG: hypothetical protein RLY93_11325 [Sumerlaeia bacterium]
MLSRPKVSLLSAAAVALALASSTFVQGQYQGGFSGIVQGDEVTLKPVEGGQELPIVDVTVFKDGHALIVHEGEVTADEGGEVLLGVAPEPVLGTFWPYLAQQGVTLSATRAKRVKTAKTKDVATLRDYLAANKGHMAEIVLSGGPAESDSEIVEMGTILEVTDEVLILDVARTIGSREPYGIDPFDSGEAREDPFAKNPAFETDEKHPEHQRKATHVVVPIGQIARATVVGMNPSMTAPDGEEDAYRLTMALDGSTTSTAVRAGLAYVQRGIRWIPNYRIDLIDDATARVRFQAMLVNEIADFEDATVRLVVGVPSIVMAGQLDPFALESIGEEMRESRGVPRRAQADPFSNAMMTQVSAFGGGAVGDMAPAAPMPEGEDAQDLYFYTLDGVTLAKGERMVVTVGAFEVPYEDVFSLDLGTSLPQAITQSVRVPDETQRRAEEALNSPKVIREIRLKNEREAPMTTGPAMVFSNGRLMAQGLVFYTAPGAESNVALNPAIDIAVDVREYEEGRRSGITINKTQYSQATMSGEIELTNRRGTPVEVEIERVVFGQITEAEGAEKVSVSPDRVNVGGQIYWPWWWRNVNPSTKLTWTVELEPGETKSVEYGWTFYLQ